jgi:hypothetical protein
MDIRTVDGDIEAYIFERHVDMAGFDAIKTGLAVAPGVRFVGQFMGAFNLFARVVAADLGELQRRVAGEYWEAGIRSDVSINLTGARPDAPKRHSPDICALVCAQVTADPFEVLAQLDELFVGVIPYGAALVTAVDFDLLIDVGGDTVEDVVDRVLELRALPGIGRTSTSLADLAGNAIRPEKS